MPETVDPGLIPADSQRMIAICNTAGPILEYLKQVMTQEEEIGQSGGDLATQVLVYVLTILFLNSAKDRTGEFEHPKDLFKVFAEDVMKSIDLNIGVIGGPTQ